MLNKLFKSLSSHWVYSFFLLALTVRFYNIVNLASWSHDNSRDVILIYKLFTYHEIIWRGPVFSVIWGFLSPIFYYLIAPVYWILNYSPLAPGLFFLLINFLTLVLLFYVVKKIYGLKVSLILGILYGFSFSVIKEGAYGLNPNFVPLFVILFFYSLYQIISLKKSKYLILLAFSSSMLISFHPGGFFTLAALPVLYFKFMPKFKFKEIISSFFTFLIFGIFPYALIEKKFDFWNLKQIIKYVQQGSAEAPKDVSRIHSFLNFWFIYLKNISLVIFATDNLIFLFLTSVLVVFICYLIFANRKKLLVIDRVLIITIVIYIFLFGLLIKFEASQGLTWWFHTCLIPLTLILIARALGYVSYKFLIPFLSIFVFFNILGFAKYTPPLDTYLVSKLSVQKIVNDSNGEDFDVYGSDDEPIDYMVWYFEKDPLLKQNYYKWVKWAKKKDSKLVYYLESFDSSMSFESSKQTIKDKHGLINEEYLGKVGESVKIYKLY